MAWTIASLTSIVRRLSSVSSSLPRCRAAAATVWILTLAACRAADPAPLADKPPAPVHETTLQFQIDPRQSEMSFTLVTDDDRQDDILRVKKIEIRRDPSAAPFQVIEDLSTETPILSGMPAFESIDMNFDGYGDVRLMEFQPAGANVPYINWLFDPGSQRFVESLELNALAAPQFDSKTGEVRSDWRDGAASYGTDFFIFKDGLLTPIRKERKEYKEPGRYTLQVLRPSGRDWKVVEQREVKEKIQ